jgi:hypothetical protein
LEEQLRSLVTGFHEVKRSETRKTINEKDEITIGTVTRREGATNVAMDLFK